MAQFSLVGSIGAVSVGTVGGAVTPAWGTGESRTAGNLLVCYVAGLQANGAPTTPGGWNKVGGTNVASRVSASIFWLLASGGDAAPTIAALSGVQWAVQLAEFSPAYAGTIAQDQLTAGATNASPGVTTTGGGDVTAGDLVVAMGAVSYSLSQTITTGHALNNGASSTESKNDATSAAYHYNFTYGSTTSNASGDSDSFSFTATNLIGTNACIIKLASFSLTATVTPSATMAAVGASSEALNEGAALVTTAAGSGATVDTLSARAALTSTAAGVGASTNTASESAAFTVAAAASGATSAGLSESAAVSMTGAAGQGFSMSALSMQAQIASVGAGASTGLGVLTSGAAQLSAFIAIARSRPFVFLAEASPASIASGRTLTFVAIKPLA